MNNSKKTGDGLQPEEKNKTKRNVVVRELKLQKRPNPLRKKFDENNGGRGTDLANKIDYIYRNFTSKISINYGDVFLADFSQSVGNELRGVHFCMAISNSNEKNQLVTVIPFHSAKEGKELNPASEVYVGQIPGETNGKEAIALINQIRTIDKIRMLDPENANNFHYYATSHEIEIGKEITVQHKFIYRLTNDQYQKIKSAMIGFLFYSYIRQE